MQQCKEIDMAIFWDVREGEGVRIDGTDVWIVTRILEHGTAAELLGPPGQRVTLHEDIPYRPGPGFRMWLVPGASEGCVRLAMEAYVPLMHRHPPRDTRPSRVRGSRHDAPAEARPR